MSNLNVSVVFCDDVRREVDGRISLMGVFEGVRLLPTHVKAIAKFNACVFVSAPEGYELDKVKIILAIHRAGKVEYEHDFPDLPQIAEIDPSIATAIAHAGMAVTLRAHYAGFVEMQNFPIHDGCVITVTASEAGSEIAANSVALLQDESSPGDESIEKHSPLVSKVEVPVVKKKASSM